MADPIETGAPPPAPQRPDVDPPPPGHHEATGTQLSPARPHSLGEHVLALAIAGMVLTAIGVLLSTNQGGAWGVASLILCSLGLLTAAAGAFLAFSSGRTNIGTACAAIATAALLLLIFAVVRQSGGGEDDDPGVEGHTGLPTENQSEEGSR